MTDFLEWVYAGVRWDFTFYPTAAAVLYGSILAALAVVGVLVWRLRLAIRRELLRAILSLYMALALVVLPGCASSIKELAGDSAIVGTTGFWLSLGLNPAPEVGGIPLPSLKLGFGTVWRVGGGRDVTITVGASGEVKAGEGGLPEAKTGPIPSLKGMSSLHITAKNPVEKKVKDVGGAGGDKKPTAMPESPGK